MKSLARTLVASAALGALATPASAVNRLFTISGAPDASFELPASPVPDLVFPDAFRIASVSGTLNGNPVTAIMEFYLAGSGGGVCAGTFCSLLDLCGPQLFSGATDAPTFVLGDYQMTDFLGNPTGRLVISEVGGGGTVPEPGTWAMLVAGFGMVGCALRTRRGLVRAGLRRRRATAVTA